MVITSGKVFPEEETQVCDTFNQYSWFLICYFVVIETGRWTGGEVNSAPVPQSATK